MIEKRPELEVRSRYEAELHVERTDISFHDLSGDRVRIQVTVHNAGAHRSPPTPMRLESAPLGAFVPWHPLAQLLVPALEPGESRELSTDVARSQPTPLGDFNLVPPNRLLTAVTSPEQSSPQSGTGFAGMLNLFRRGQTTRSSGGDLAARRSLAPDLWELVGRGQAHWAGNINVFIGTHPVERHLAKALRVYPGRTNLAMFVVGGPGKRDAYAFEVVGLAPDWNADLYDTRNNRSLVINPADVPIEEMQWVESDGGLIVMLATQPPADCRTGNLEVHVTRRSCGETAVVEFNLDPAAQGAGCYYV
ncbi:MAG TPA: hypothetical protein VN578_25210 [Candidatus Binatia bacterium]|nr:hypothetical protein [Candidatus Binatia bacterium]